MKRHLIAVALLAVSAAPLFAQKSDSDKVVATINGESVTKGELDALWFRIGERMQQEYEKNGGGKLGLLENYIGKRLVVQQAVRHGFGKAGKLDPQAESELFNRYVREIIAPSIVPEESVREFYDSNPADFTHPEQAKVHIIHVSMKSRLESDAQEILAGVLEELFPLKGDPAKLLEAFGSAARTHSEHPSARKSGNIGWVARGVLDPALDEAAFTMRPGALSGIIKEHGELHLLLLEKRRPAGKETYEEVHSSIHDYLLSKNAPKVMQALNEKTRELRESGKVAVFAENLK